MFRDRFVSTHDQKMALCFSNTLAIIVPFVVFRVSISGGVMVW